MTHLLWRLSFILSFLLALYTIVFHLQFFILPLSFMLLGTLSYLIHPRRALYLFFFLLPCINSLPDLFLTPYPYNYLAISLFYLSGIVFAAFIKREGLKIEGRWFAYYRFFLLLFWISVIFVFLRWSNFDLSLLALFKDTPVTPSGERLSFAAIFPVLTLFLFGVPPFIFPLIKTRGLETDKIVHSLLGGYGLSLFIALGQKFVNPDFLCRPHWAGYNQFNGGFSDFNAFGFFSGFIFLLLTILLIRRFTAAVQPRFLKSPGFWLYTACLLLSFGGIVISGSRTAFLFVLAAVVCFLFSKAIRPQLKIISLSVLVVLVLLAGGMVRTRLYKTADKFIQGLKSQGIVQALDRASNRRITMIRDSAAIIGAYPLNGVGGGNFLFYLKNMHFGEEFLQDLPLNQYLLILDEVGLIGFLAFLLFLGALWRGAKGPYAPLWYTILLALLVGNSLWLPEVAVLFWILIALMKEDGDMSEIGGWQKIALTVLAGLFIAANIVTFHALHPLTWSRQAAARYDYGFWPPDPGPEGKLFRWSRGAAGIYLPGSANRQIKLFAGAPIQRLKGKIQSAAVYWQGRRLKTVVFKENRHETIVLDSAEPGFFELRVSPTFNLKKMGLGRESRNLGVQVYHLE
jgi:hypothetical protein